MSESVEQKNAKLIRKLVFIVIGMFGFGYALVPLYDVFCDAFGILGKTDDEAFVEQVYEVDVERELTVEFLTSLNESTPMEFRAATKKMKIHPGKYYTVNFFAKNMTDQNMTARAVPSVSPGPTAEYFKKTECFCYTEQSFEPQEGKTMPVRFVVDPDIPDRYKTITLSYTFFDNTVKSVKK